MATYSGIDVSKYQGDIDWKKVKKDGVNFAMIRSGYSTTVDTRFETNYKNATAAGVNAGVYHFSYATSVAKARAEAEFVLNLLKGKKLQYPVAYDFEEESVQYVESRGITVTKSLATAMAKEFLSTVEAAGYYVMLYSNLNCINKYFNIDELKAFDLWYSQWAPSPTYDGNFGIWQKSSTGEIDGIYGNVDLDVSYKDYPEIMRKNGLNGYSKPDPDVVISGSVNAKSDEIDIYLLQSVLKTLYRKGLVSADCAMNGVYDDSTVAAVKDIQKRAGYAQTGLCDQQTVKFIYDKMLLTL